MILKFCVACGDTEDLEQHHLQPKVLGGSDDETNLITFCSRCHDIAHQWLRKSDRVALQKEGIENARANNPRAYRGRKPTYTHRDIDEIESMKRDGYSVSVMSKQMGLSRQAIYRILDNPFEARSAISRWSLQ